MICHYKIWKISTRFLKRILAEISIVFIFIFLINNYIGNVDKTINADGAGYYDYLPSLFIHHDLNRKDIPREQSPELYERISDPAIYIDFGEYKVNKYACGTALLQLPFFAYARMTNGPEGNPDDGYQYPYQRAVFYAAIFYLFLSLLFLKKVLRLYGIRNSVIIPCQLLLATATAVTHYANYDAAYSHVYSLFAITAFSYYVKAYFDRKNLYHFLISSLFLGLVVILRQINILIILFVPFLAGSGRNFTIGLRQLLRHPFVCAAGILSVSAIFSIQCLLWYLQTGHFFLYSYGVEGFDFSNPHLISILFSYKKGLFIYTPVLFICMMSVIWLIFKRKSYLAISWAAFFLIITYIFSSWWSWYYGCSYGMRVYIDYYTVFFIPFALMVNGMAAWRKAIVIAFSFLTIPLNVIQTYQYKQYILHWIEMDEKKYWKVFLKTSRQYEGLVWKRPYDPGRYIPVDEIVIGTVEFPDTPPFVVYEFDSRDVPFFNDVGIIQLLVDDHFNENNELRISLIIKPPEGDDYHYRHDIYLIHLAEDDHGKWQTGYYNFEFVPLKESGEKVIRLLFRPGNEKVTLQNVRVRFLRSV
ncbi:MAG: hypothetical protein JW861_01790 [Bacteroidales bacterium]|nr:hypothetical protein [Bacteroidales bacterium]